MPDQGTIKARYTGAATTAASRYRDAFTRGVTWQAPASSDSAEANYATGVQNAIVKKSRAAGVRKVSDTEFNQAALSKGAPIIGTRITAAGDKQAQRFEPVRAALSALTLAPRGLDPDANIDNRVKPIAHAARRAVGKE
jgi:hypothetical protein